MTIHWKAVEQYFNAVLFVFLELSFLGVKGLRPIHCANLLSFFSCNMYLCFLDTPVVLVQLVENPPWVKHEDGRLLPLKCL